jgi:hypothetical protein
VRQITINPETLMLGGFDSLHAYSAGDFARLTANPPPCTVCGTPVTIQRIDVTLNRQDEIENGRTYIPGMWECPRYCNRMTGERYHGGFHMDISHDGWHYTCSCGADERGTTAAELNRIHCEHGGSVRP